jgi:tRNA U34 5-methylaminomethyl-2-thiouridine-forming methyltransferase MnmC
MKREIITTSDGSKTIQIVDWDEQYHSIHGALQEAVHIYIGAGLMFKKQEVDSGVIQVLEMGFGTGLNCFLSFQEAEIGNFKIQYTGIEAFPVSNEEHNELRYDALLEQRFLPYFKQIYTVNWKQEHQISDLFSLQKVNATFEQWMPPLNEYDVIYFDAFGPPVQPELWTLEMFQKMYGALRSKGILITYCAKGQVKRNLREAGFFVENLPGPPGKREITRAIKL